MIYRALDLMFGLINERLPFTFLDVLISWSVVALKDAFSASRRLRV